MTENITLDEFRQWKTSMAAKLGSPAATMGAISVTAGLRMAEIHATKVNNAGLAIEIDTLRELLGDVLRRMPASRSASVPEWTRLRIGEVLGLPAGGGAKAAMERAKAAFDNSNESLTDRLAAEFNRSIARTFPGGEVHSGTILAALATIFAVYHQQLPPDQLRERIRALTTWMLGLLPKEPG